MPNMIIGLLSVSLGLWGISVWWYSVEEFLRGGLPLLLVLFGVVALMAGVRGERMDRAGLDQSKRED